jgi:hypothetical protein
MPQPKIADRRGLPCPPNHHHPMTSPNELKRPRELEFALSFCGDPEEPIARQYIEALEARATLAQPGPQGPSDEEFLAMRSWSSHGPTFDSDLVNFGRRCYMLAKQPVSLPYKLPEPKAPSDEDLPALAQPKPESAFTHLAARPLLERVARMADCIDQRTVGEIIAISNQAEAWLSGNPPGQPVAIKPRGCPTPDACSCVEPAAQPEPEGPTDEEWEALKERLFDHHRTVGYQGELFIYDRDFDSALDDARQELARWGRPAIRPVTVAERPWEREGWRDADGRCWWGRPSEELCNSDWHLATRAEVEKFCSDCMPIVSLPAHALPTPQPTPGP